MPGHVAVTGRTWSLSFRRVCIAIPIWRRLLMSFVALARPRAAVNAGIATAKRIAMIPATMSHSISVGCAWFLFNIVSAVVHAVFGAIPGIGGILVFSWAIIAALVHLLFLVIMIVTIVKAFTGVRWEIPYIGPVARKQAEGGTV